MSNRDRSILPSHHINLLLKFLISCPDRIPRGLALLQENVAVEIPDLDRHRIDYAS